MQRQRLVKRGTQKYIKKERGDERKPKEKFQEKQNANTMTVLQYKYKKCCTNSTNENKK